MARTRELYRQSALPVFQNRMYGSAQEAKESPRGDVVLVEDEVTGLVYNEAFHPEIMHYDSSYQNEQAVSGHFRDHLSLVAEIVARSLGRASLIEVGCGKGYFLELLAARQFNISGFDPTYEGNNPLIRKEYFDSSAGTKADGLILRHVLEHIQDPFGFLEKLREANGGHGRIYIEVPCLDWICQHNAWFDIFYEHVNYFRLSDFQRMFGSIVEMDYLFGGQYLYVVADLASLQPPHFDADQRVSFPSNFTRSLEAIVATTKNNKRAVWGGASKGVIFTLLCERMGFSIDAIIDINPAKQGKYLPGSGMIVHSPREALHTLPHGSTIFVMNSNYFEEIKAMSNNTHNYVKVDNE